MATGLSACRRFGSRITLRFWPGGRSCTARLGRWRSGKAKGKSDKPGRICKVETLSRRVVTLIVLVLALGIAAGAQAAAVIKLGATPVPRPGTPGARQP